MELTEELKNEFLKDIAKFAVSTGHRVTASVTEYKDGDRCMSVIVFEPEAEECDDD